MTVFLLRIAAADRCLSALSDEYRHQLKQSLSPSSLYSSSRALLARASAAAARSRRRRADRVASSTLLHKRRRLHGSHSFLRLLQRRLDMATHHEIRRRSSAADRLPAEHLIPAAAPVATATTTTFSSPSDISQTTPPAVDAKTPAEKRRSNHSMDCEAMPPPPTPTQQTDGTSSARHSRQTSSASRNANRLSLTLPVAPPTSDPTRQAPLSAASSVPPTPAESSGAASPSDPNDFIIAIAAQERKVLELREELARAEADLTSLKKRWTAQDHANGAAARRVDTPRSVPPSPAEDNMSSRRSLDLDRRKLLLQNQNTPTQSRRRVIRGGHTRTLSLLSPGKTPGSLSGLDQQMEAGALGLPQPRMEKRTPEVAHPNLSHRASWQPRIQQSPIGGYQLVEDFRTGLRAFVEDIRQITVGDEPISGQSPRPSGHGRRSESVSLGGRSSPLVDSDTIRASNNPTRVRASAIFDSPSSTMSSPTPSNSSSSRREGSKDSKAKGAKSKHFSWTPLSLDSVDDNDWSNWESSPTPVKTTRWSGSTIHSGEIDDIQAIPERAEESTTSVQAKHPRADSVIMPPKLEEILPTVVNRLTPSNIKRTATNLMDEWEKSLMAPEQRDKENAA